MQIFDDPVASLIVLVLCCPGLLPMVGAWAIGRYVRVNLSGVVSRRERDRL